MIKKAKEKEENAGAACACQYGYTKPDDFPSCMYDEETGIPSFNLFEDRLKMALINERVKDLRMRKLKIAVVGIYIENLSDWTSPSFRAAVLRQTAELLTGALPQNYTVARGINYPFWIMMPYLSTREDAEVLVDKIRTLLGRKNAVGGEEYKLKCRFGVSIFEHDPEDTVTTLVGKAIAALQKAVSGKRDVVYFIELTKG